MKWLIAMLAIPAAAHTLQVTGVTLRLDRSGTSVSVAAHAPLLHGADPAREIPRRLQLKLDGQPFRPIEVRLRRDPQYDNFLWTGRDPRTPSRVAVESAIFPDRPEDTTIVLVFRDGQLIERTALNAAHPGAMVGETVWSVGQRFSTMGIAHILSGADHLLFLCGLLLMGGPLLRLLGVVTAFTAAHCLTLSLTALGISSLSPRLVEPMIALSIVVVGVENLLRRKPQVEFRVWLAFGFGFFHGFGFAGALTEAGLPTHAMAWSLAAFNVGVEMGQGLVLLAVLPLLALLQQQGENTYRATTRFASVAITLVGAAWFTARMMP